MKSKRQLLEAKLRRIIKEELLKEDSEAQKLLSMSKKIRNFASELMDFADWTASSIDTSAEKAVSDLYTQCMLTVKTLNKIASDLD